MIEISEDMYEILLAMGVLILAGGFFFFKTDNHIVDLLNKHYKYNQKKLSRIIAVGIWGVALSCIPVLLSEIYNKMYLNIFSIVIFAVIIVIISVYERKGKLK